MLDEHDATGIFWFGLVLLRTAVLIPLKEMVWSILKFLPLTCHLD